MEHEPIIKEEEHFESIKEFWDELMKLTEEDDAEGVEYLLLHREFPYKKLPGEDEIYSWLKGRAENKLGRKLQVELNEEGIIVPINSEHNE